MSPPQLDLVNINLGNERNLSPTTCLLKTDCNTSTFKLPPESGKFQFFIFIYSFPFKILFKACIPNFIAFTIKILFQQNAILHTH
jgi:hypothetical protein